MNHLLKLFGVTSVSQLSYADRMLYNDILSLKNKKGGGYSIRPDLGELNGMSIRTGYLDKHPPIFVGELLEGVASVL